MKVKEAIQQLSKMDQDAELVIEFDEFPGQFSPVLDFEKAGDSSSKYMAKGSLERYYEDDETTELLNVRNIVVCSGQEP